MDWATVLPYLAQAIGGAVSGNVTGALTRGGGGFLGRTIIGAVAGVTAGWLGENVAAVGAITSAWRALIDGANGQLLYHLITGALGGGIIGLISGFALRSRP